MPTKRCTTCGRTKPVTLFFKDKKGKHGVGSRCKPCFAKYFRKFYKKHKARYHQHSVESTARSKEAVMRLIKEAGGKCTHCPEDHPAVLDFHHKDPRTKVIGIGEACAKRWPMRSWPWTARPCAELGAGDSRPATSSAPGRTATAWCWANSESRMMCGS